MTGFLLYGVFSLCFQLFCKPPWHQPQMLTMCSVGAILTTASYLLISRKYSLFAFTMWFGGIPLYAVLFLLAWIFS